MRFNAIIVTTILSAGVFGIAIDNLAPAGAVEVTKAAPGTTTEAETALKSLEFYEEEEDEEKLGKREAKYLWAWSPTRRPTGLPVGKREVKSQPSSGWSHPYRSIGLPVGKRDDEPDVEKKKSHWTWPLSHRPLGLPAGKRGAQG